MTNSSTWTALAGVAIVRRLVHQLKPLYQNEMAMQPSIMSISRRLLRLHAFDAPGLNVVTNMTGVSPIMPTRGSSKSTGASAASRLANMQLPTGFDDASDAGTGSITAMS